MVRVGQCVTLRCRRYANIKIKRYYSSEDSEYYYLSRTPGGEGGSSVSKDEWEIFIIEPDSILDVPEVRPGYFCSKRKQTINEHGG